MRNGFRFAFFICVHSYLCYPHFVMRLTPKFYRRKIAVALCGLYFV